MPHCDHHICAYSPRTSGRGSSRSITVNVVYPGMTRTKIIDKEMTGGGTQSYFSINDDHWPLS